MLVLAVSIASLLFLALLGAIGAKAGGANILRATLRVTFWGAFAMLLADLGADVIVVHRKQAPMMNLLMVLGQSGGLVAERGQSLLDGPHWCRVYRTADGGFISVQCIESKFYALFLDRLGLAADPQFAKQFDRDLWPELGNRLAAIFAAKPRDEWTSLFESSDACVSPVLSPCRACRKR